MSQLKPSTGKNSRPVNQDLEVIRNFTGSPPIPMHSNPLASALNCELLSLDRQLGHIELGFRPQARLALANGTATRAAQTAMIDFSMGFAGMAAVGDQHTISTLTLDLHPVQSLEGKYWTAKAWVQARQPDTLSLRAQLFCDGKLALLASSSLLVIALAT